MFDRNSRELTPENTEGYVDSLYELIGANNDLGFRFAPP